ncbi:hypothetical protein ACFXG4_29085 [Nocardia sp. NPDC059246]|uniref:hypothetical protein n=1 Tax=unclassified Nocardia TaxID=2637762 RepID=UPI003691C488
MPTPTRTTFVYRLLALVASALLAPAITAATPCAPATAAPATELNHYCTDHGASSHLADGHTVYCTQVQSTDAFVWSYTRDPMPHDPNSRRYTCDAQACRWPDGTYVPNYLLCGLLCGEPPTNGDIQSGLADCLATGAEFEDCEARLR